jgi:hypothetical protein
MVIPIALQPPFAINGGIPIHPSKVRQGEQVETGLLPFQGECRMHPINPPKEA